jgi:hypothetical protein
VGKSGPGMPPRLRPGTPGTTPRPTSWSPSDDPIASPCSFVACARRGSPYRAPRRVARRLFSCPRSPSRPVPARDRSRRDLPTRAYVHRADGPCPSRCDARRYLRSTRGTTDRRQAPRASRRARSISRRRPSHWEISLLHVSRGWHRVASTRGSSRSAARTFEATRPRTPPRRGPRAPPWTASSRVRDWPPTPGTMTVAALCNPSLCVPNPLSLTTYAE